jgi:hypothetical protein
MDYLRIYDRFIASRKANQTPSCAYVEVRHIKPRSLGGTDEPDNLIRLTPEDHFFAHLLLAKGYRRRDLWAACIALAGFHNAGWCLAENAENADLRIVRTKWQGKVPEVYGATKQKAA